MSNVKPYWIVILKDFLTSPWDCYVYLCRQTLRKRYNALKEQADVEEVRVRVEERRRELQGEFDDKRKQLEKDLGLSQASACHPPSLLSRPVESITSVGQYIQFVTVLSNMFHILELDDDIEKMDGMTTAVQTPLLLIFAVVPNTNQLSIDFVKLWRQGDIVICLWQQRLRLREMAPALEKSLPGYIIFPLWGGRF